MPDTCWSVALPQVKPSEAILERYGAWTTHRRDERPNRRP